MKTFPDAYGRISKDSQTKKKPKRKQLVKELDRVFSLFIRKRDRLENKGDKCFVCGQVTDRPQCGHLISRSCFSVRWVPLNCNTVCPGCNYRHEFRPEYHTLRFIEENGSSVYDKLVQLSKQAIKHDTVCLQTMIDYYREETEKMK